jgi:adenine C2-methylase RlmN of 23S rRNA A2503 and tRNA A37
MSYSFDTMQQAIEWLYDRYVNDDAQAEDLFQFLRESIEDLHTYSHKVKDEPNRVAKRSANLLEVALKYPNDDERAMWLRVKGRV